MCDCQRMGSINWGDVGKGTNVRALCNHRVQRNGSGVMWREYIWCSNYVRRGSIGMAIENSGRWNNRLNDDTRWMWNSRMGGRGRMNSIDI